MPNSLPNQNRVSALDRILAQEGPEGLQKGFNRLASQNRVKAAAHINDDALTFPCLFLLLPQIYQFDLWHDLAKRHILALQLCAKKWGNASLEKTLAALVPKDPEARKEALLWMFQSGNRWDGPKENYDSYDAALDAAAATLIKTYKDRRILPDLVELMFRRNKKDLLIHDLAWCCMTDFDAELGRLVARRLLSGDEKDVALACHLLHLNPPEPPGNANAKGRLYRQYLSWLSENQDFLYPTRECFQMTSSPEPLGLNHDAKYIGRKVSPKSHAPQGPLNEKEVACLGRFHEISPEEKEFLASYSKKLHDRSKRQWDEWMQKPVGEQLRLARSGMGVRR